MIKEIKILTLAAFILAMAALPATAREKVNKQWQATLLAAIDSFPQRGGYYTGGKPTADFPTTAWQGLEAAFGMAAGDVKPHIDPRKAQPSFCSSATYLALMKALTMWDTGGKISRQAWARMKPCVGIAGPLNPQGLSQDDGVGFWGRANANGPSMGVLINELGAGMSYTAYRGAKSERNKETPTERYLTDEEWCADPIWSHMVPGDILKIFWNRNDESGSDRGAIIGYNGVKGDDQEAGHSVIFMGFDKQGNVTYWSSNGPGKEPATMGYSLGRCPKTQIQRIVVTRILHPERFDRVKHMPLDDVNQYLHDLNGKRHSTTAELKRECGIK